MIATETMSSITESISRALGIDEKWIEQRGVSWIMSPALNPRRIAVVMNSILARFVTITASELPASQGFRLEYLWDLEGKLLGFVISITGTSIDSIYDLCEAVDWIEREIHEGFAIDFLGRTYEPLLLRAGDAMGVNLHEEAK
jgi:hypothetical protein